MDNQEQKADDRGTPCDDVREVALVNVIDVRAPPSIVEQNSPAGRPGRLPPGDDFRAFCRSPATWRAYGSAWRRFCAWCAAQRQDSLPAAPATVAAYLAELAHEGKAWPTIRKAVEAIRAAHLSAGLESPSRAQLVVDQLAGLRRAVARPPRRVDALGIDEVRGILPRLPAGLRGKRDAALLLVGLAGALRRSELVALRVEDCRWSPQGVTLHLGASKTDRFSAGDAVALPLGRREDACPVRALRAWLEAAQLSTGPVFREVTRHGRVGANALDPKSVGEVVKSCAALVGLDVTRIGAHSLRAGFATSCVDAGVHDVDAMRHGRWGRADTFAGYVRRRGEWRDNPAGRLF